MTDDEEDVSGGGVRLQVDRKRLEAMITGKPVYGTSILLPNANDFFDKVASLSGAQILWPRELKIGAKTKKDPYVKIIGTPEQVDSARQLISATLQRKRDRVTLKLLISHESHSHIIGRGGRGSKRIMQASACHIHFPDANRHGSNGYVDASQPMDEIKGDQVSVTGAPEHAERARVLLRENSLVVVSFELPWFGPNPPPLPTLLPQITASINSLPPAWIITLRSATQDVAFLKESISIITAKLVPHACWTPELRAEFRSSALLLQPQATMLRTLFELAEFENVRVRLYSEQRSVLMCGSFEGVVRVREFLIQQLPVTLCFDCPNERLPASLKEIEKQFDVEATVKRRTSMLGGASSAAAAAAAAYSTSAADHSVIVLRTREEHVARLYHTREHILGLEHSERPLSQAALASTSEAANSGAGTHPMHQPAPPIEAADANGDVNGNEMLFHALVDADISSLEQQFASAAVASSPNTIPQRPSSLLSPNPMDSPIAHSLLKSAKEIDNNKKSEIWRTDEGVMARQELLLKANRAVFDSSFHHIRYPTDLWSGLGFSASLPADLIRAAAASDAHVETDEHEDDEHDFSREGSSSSSSLSLLHNSSSSPLALPAGLAGSNSFHSSPSRTGLASVIEDEELSEYNTSTLDFSRKQRMPSKKKKLLVATAPAMAATAATNPPPRQSNSFSASSSFFETASPIGHDLPWDVDVFRDPAMVLAQLGCSEYLPQFRAQEIDMRALLLSDEQSLKEIGVATVGARKKIAHAILKLRESARAKGYDI